MGTGNGIPDAGQILLPTLFPSLCGQTICDQEKDKEKKRLHLKLTYAKRMLAGFSSPQRIVPNRPGYGMRRS